MAVNAKSAGAWKVSTLWTRQAGAWQKPKVWVREAGVWKEISVVVIALTIAANTQNYNIKDAAIAAGWDGIGSAEITLTINAGVYVGSSSTGTPGLQTGTGIPAGTTITIINNGNVYGRGGKGGKNGNIYGPGGAGGSAFRADAAVAITNNGTFAGGGGGAGSGNAGSYGAAAGAGGGGAGYSGGSAGAGGATAGSTTTGGTGGTGGTAYSGNGENQDWGGNGGTGGGRGATGGAGKDYQASGTGKPGGAAGKYVQGNSLITWAVAGTRLGGVSA